jgi:ribosomal protein S12 methylthiotransferase accessory factor
VIGWRWGARLDGKGEVLIPACAVHCPAPGGPLLGPLVVRWTSNGSAVHTSAAAAQRHALFEAVERDQLARTLPEGWTPKLLRARRLRTDGLPPALLQRLAELEARGLMAHLFDLTPERGLGIPVAGALLVDAQRGAIPLTAGYAAAEVPVRALEGALLEAVQSRLTEIHGAREDVDVEAREEAAAVGELLSTVSARRGIAQMPTLPARARTASGLARWLGERGHPVAAVRMAASNVPVEAWKVIVQGFFVTELL